MLVPIKSFFFHLLYSLQIKTSQFHFFKNTHLLFPHHFLNPLVLRYSSQKMLSLPPSPPVPRNHIYDLNQIVVSKDQQSTSFKRVEINTCKSSTFRQPHPRRTEPAVWFGAILCLIFSLLLIFFGIATLIVFLLVRPRIPFFDTPNARLSSIYVGSPQYFNSDFTLLANFSNPNQKIDVVFEYAGLELYFSDRLIATRSLQPFTQRQGEMRLESVHMISSFVYLPQNLALELRKQVVSNKVYYDIRGTFKVRATLGLIHYTYWLHTRCQLEMTGPPIGVLVARSCKTKR